MYSSSYHSLSLLPILSFNLCTSCPTTSLTKSTRSCVSVVVLPREAGKPGADSCCVWQVFWKRREEKGSAPEKLRIIMSTKKISSSSFITGNLKVPLKVWSRVQIRMIPRVVFKVLVSGTFTRR